MNSPLVFGGCLFGVVGSVVYLLSQWIANRADTRLRDRLRATDEPTQQPAPTSSGISEMFARLGQAAAKPFEPKSRERQSELRRKLARAGIYAPSAARIMIGFRVILGAAGVVGGYAGGVAMGNPALGLSVGGLIGYLAPNFWLKLRIKRQQEALDMGLADALDLLVICVESGLTIDSAMQRVGQEIAMAHPSLSREFEMTHMETRVGLARADALRNLGTRTGNGALVSLASMLIQSERFGTSIASALRVHGESLRTARQNAAEELAAKATVKLSFPVVLFIFPAVLIVLAGPAVIGLFKSSLMQ